MLQIFFIAIAKGLAQYQVYLVTYAVHQAETDFMVRVAVRKAIPSQSLATIAANFSYGLGLFHFRPSFLHCINSGAPRFSSFITAMAVNNLETEPAPYAVEFVFFLTADLSAKLNHLLRFKFCKATMVVTLYRLTPKPLFLHL